MAAVPPVGYCAERRLQPFDAMRPTEEQPSYNTGYFDEQLATIWVSAVVGDVDKSSRWSKWRS